MGGAYPITMSLRFHRERGQGFEKIIEELGALRIRVFRDWPYLYEGDLEYEKKYLRTYVNAPTSFGFFVYDGDQMVGATTAVELEHESDEFKKPFIDKKLDVSQVVYFGESILLPKYRGQGIGKRFMHERLEYTRSFDNKLWAAFCAVVRDAHHVLRPKGYQELDGFWRASGFSPREGMIANFTWKDLDKNEQDQKKLQFWLQQIKGAE